MQHFVISAVSKHNNASVQKEELSKTHLYTVFMQDIQPLA